MLHDDNVQGIDDAVPEQDALKVNTSRVILRYVIFFAAGWAMLAAFLQADRLFIAALVAFFGFLSGIALHGLERHLLSRIVWIVVANIAIFTASIVTPREANMNFILLAATIVPFVVFCPRQHRILLLNLVGLSVALWLLSQLPLLRGVVGVDGNAQVAVTVLSPAASFTTFGVVLFVMGYFTQTSEAHLAALRVTHHKLVTADALKKQLLANISHELRTPLHAVHGYAELLDSDIAKVPATYLKEARTYPVQILRACQSMLQQIENIFAFVTWNDRPFVPDPEDLCLRNEVSDILAGFASEIATKQLRIDQSCLEPLRIRSDKQMVQMALKQVIGNGIKFSEQEGNLVVSAMERPDRFIEVCVKDQGPGFAERDSVEAFVPFERLTFETSATPGVGLGLPLARAAAERIGGRVEILDEGIPGGVVSVTLPVAS